MSQPEAEIKRKIKRCIEDAGGYWCAIKGGIHAKPGDPDLVVCYLGRFIAIEAKSSSGSLSEVQKTRARQITDAGGLHITARSVDDV